jgi:hypothetical protein
MGRQKQKLELTWIGKDERPKLEPRILLEEPSLSYHADKRVSDQDIFDNILIQGDNLLALKAEALIRWIEFANQIADAESKKHWRYILVPDNAISATATLDGLKSTYTH